MLRGVSPPDPTLVHQPVPQVSAGGLQQSLYRQVKRISASRNHYNTLTILHTQAVTTSQSARC